MTRSSISILVALMFALSTAWTALGWEDPSNPTRSSVPAGRKGVVDKNEAVEKKNIVRADEATTWDEARGRAKLLHESIHSTLQYVHREYYREDEGLKIPAKTLNSVFRDLEQNRNIKVRWVAVNAQPMNVDHVPKDTFEKAAVTALTEGKEFHEAREKGTYRFAGTIQLHAECLKCHAPSRTSNKPRAAALMISLPVNDAPRPAIERLRS